MKTVYHLLSVSVVLTNTLLILSGAGTVCFAQGLQEIPENVLQLGETNGDLVVSPVYTEIQTTTETPTVTSFHFTGSDSPKGTVQFSGTGSNPVIHVDTMNVEQGFTNDIDLNGVSLHIENMTNDRYGMGHPNNKTAKITPKYSITNTSETLSTLSITRSDYSQGVAPLQDVNRSSITGNIQVEINPVTTFPPTSEVTVAFRNKYDRVYLNGTNTYTGGTVVNGGEYQGVYTTTLHAPAKSLGTGDLTLRNHATLMNALSNDTYTNNIILDDGGCLRTGAGNSQTFTGNISGTGDLYLNYNEANGGNITLTGNNTYDGDTHLCGYLKTTQAGSGANYTVHAQSDHAFSDGDIIFNSAAEERQYQVTLELDNPGGTRVISNNIDVSYQKAIFSKGEGTVEAIIAGQLTGENASMIVNEGVNFRVDLDNWVLPSDGEFLYMWNMRGTLEFQTDTVISIYTSDMARYEGRQIYLAPTDKVTGAENIRIDLSHAQGNGEWETGTDPAKGFYIKYTSKSTPTPVDAPEPASGLMMLLGLLLLLRRRK